MKNPCVKECPRRTAECHASCKDYAKFAAWRAEERRKKQEKQAEKVGLSHGVRRLFAMRFYNDNHKKI